MTLMSEDAYFIRIAKKLFRYDEVIPTYGWPHDIYYDMKSKKFIVEDFFGKGEHFELEELPRGEGLMPINVNGKTVVVRFYY